MGFLTVWLPVFLIGVVVILLLPPMAKLIGSLKSGFVDEQEKETRSKES